MKNSVMQLHGNRLCAGGGRPNVYEKTKDAEQKNIEIAAKFLDAS
jgi:hypothetical protein